METTYLSIKAIGLLGLRFFNFSEDGIVFDVFPNWLVIAYICAGVTAYLLGSINFAVVISRLRYHDDIRKHGSGNAGMTNMIRTYGTLPGIITFVLDLLKAVVAVLGTMALLGEAAAYFAGLCCILGHAYPVFHRFKGGKGVAVCAATILCIEPPLFAVLLIIFIGVVLFSRYISLGSIMSVLMLPVLLPQIHNLIYGEEYNPFFFIAVICSLLITLLVLLLHRANIKRLLDHTENKFSFKKKGSANSGEGGGDGQAGQ